MLPPLRRRAEEEPAAFAARAAASIAAELHVPLTAHTTEDKRKLLGRLRRSVARRLVIVTRQW